MVAADRFLVPGVQVIDVLFKKPESRPLRSIVWRVSADEVMNARGHVSQAGWGLCCVMETILMMVYENTCGQGPFASSQILLSL